MPAVIDTHHHILPSFFFRETNDDAHPVGGLAPAPWDAESDLAFMDQAGIDVAITSISTPGVHVGDDARARRLARRCNELSASLIQRWPRRFGSFAALPLPDVDGALEELAYADDILKLDGAVLFSIRTVSISATRASSPYSKSCNDGASSSSSILRLLPIRLRISWVCRTILSTSPPTPPEPSRKCTTRAASPARLMSNTSCPMPGVLCLISLAASRSSTRWDPSRVARPAAPRQPRYAGFTTIQRLRTVHLC